MKKLRYIPYCVAVIILASCQTINAKNPYLNMVTVTYENNKAYEFINANSNKLIIYIDGTGWFSVLGWKPNDKWESVGFINRLIINSLQEDCNILIPERLNMEIGKFYRYNVEMRRKYTLNNLVESYSFTINNYLKGKNYSSIILSGGSEGAGLLPLIYEKLENKENITGMVSISYGGLSLYEQVKVLGKSGMAIPDFYREACLNIDELRKEVELYPDSIGEVWGYTFRWWNSFMDYSPYDYYRNINIPILFVHGNLDTIVPVESTQYIENNLPGKPFDYIYIDDADHYYNTLKSKKIFNTKIIKWVKEHL